MDQTDLNAWLPIALVRVYGSGQRWLLLGFQDGHFMPIGSVSSVESECTTGCLLFVLASSVAPLMMPRMSKEHTFCVGAVA